KPDYHEAHYNFGIALGQQGKLHESIARLEHALRVKPDYGDAHMSRAMAWLLQGKLDQGWQEYEWRWKCKNTKKPPFRQPLWDGSPLEGKAILLHVEQGLGDTIQFIRYAPVVKKLGGNVAVLCQRPLTRLLASCSSIDFLTCKPDEVPPVDLQAPLMSLPGIFRNTLQTIPADVPYLSADAGLVEHWRQKLGCPADPPHKPDAPARDTAGNPSLALRAGVGPFRIGIAWQGNPKYLGDRLRSIPLVKFAPLAQVEGVCLISLQKGPGADQVRAVQDHFRVVDLGPEVDEAAGPFMDTAAIITNLDLVITSDTAIPHLAGALGVPVWTALAYAPDWRFLLEREDSPWYPTMRLFRQKKLGDWDEVFDRIAQELANKLGTAYHRRDSVLSQLDAGSDLPTPTRTAREGSSLALGVSVAPKTPAASTVELIDTRRISIITPWRDHPELIEDYERAVAGAEVIIIDNASRPEHAQQLQAMVDRLRGVYLRNEENRGFAAANNQGMVRATGDILVFLNSDISASPGFLNMVLRDVRGDVLVGPSLHRQLVYGLWVPYLEGWCLAGRRGVWERLGGWDADAYPEPYWEDNDVCFRAVESGMQLVQARWPVQHKGGRTTTSVARWGESFERNRATFAARVRTLCERRREQKRADGEEEPVIVPSVHPQGPVAAKPFLNGQTLAERYHLACTCPSDINEHCTTLYALAQESRQITELGTRRGVSTTALLYAQPDKIACYDKWRYPQVDELQQLAGRTELVFHQADVLKVEIEPTDLLFIDTLHVYEQLRDELRLHADKARKYIVLHDTTTFADRGELEGSKGIWSAVEEFLAQRTFRLKQRHTHNNGLTVLERAPSAPESGDGGSP
ncbi:MAG: glycosyltransferase, partial [Planctomycetes bacterium]|nr:glycosyltransferase [Planctomycetota bacterium]